MASKAAANAAKGGIRDWLMPEINDIKVQLAKIRGDIKAINARIDSLTSEVKDLRENMNVVQRLAVLEAKVSEYEKQRQTQ